MGGGEHSHSILGEALRIHCTATRCYGIDLDGSKMVSFDPTDGSVTVAFE